mgnify:CR=1 FL=1
MVGNVWPYFKKVHGATEYYGKHPMMHSPFLFSVCPLAKGHNELPPQLILRQLCSRDNVYNPALELIWQDHDDYWYENDSFTNLKCHS